jgi:pilus assembly protein CpaB
MKDKRRIIGIVAAVLCAVLGTVSLVGYVNSTTNEVETREALKTVYVVDKLVPKGSDAKAIKASVSTDKVPKRLVQPGAIDDLDEVSAKEIAASDLQPGDQLVSARLVDKAKAGSLDDKVQVSAQFAADRVMGGAIAKGDTVGVYLSTEPPVSPYQTHLVFQHVLVTNVQTTTEPVEPEEPEDGKKKAELATPTAPEYIVTLALTPAQSEHFVFAGEFGYVWLSNQPASATDDGTQTMDGDQVLKPAKADNLPKAAKP